jgi:hypothetical protein
MARIGQPIELTLEEKQVLLTRKRSYKFERRYPGIAMTISYSSKENPLIRL